MILNKLFIGTANFNKNYNLINNYKVEKREIKEIFRYLRKKKIFNIDTAINYDNEGLLKFFCSKSHNIVTKIDLKNFTLNKKNWSSKKNYLINLKEKLKIKNFYGVLIHITSHNEIKNENCKKLINLLLSLKKKKLIKKIGFSIYEPKDADAILGTYNIDLIQIPLNLFDRRFEKQGYLEKFKKKHIEIHIRSIFLQGLLLENKVPKNFKHWTRNFKQIDEWTSLNNISKLQACIQYILGIAEVDKVIIGVNNLRQLKQIVKNFKKPSRHINFSQNFGSSNLKLIDPRKWI